MVNWKDKIVLVTGAGGFIGSHLVEKLISSGATTRVYIRYTSRPHLGFLEEICVDKNNKFEIIRGDLRDSHAVAQAVKGAHIVFHLGALIGIPYSYVHPYETVETNIMGTFNVLAAAMQNKVDRIIHTSTSEVYGTGRYVPMDESHPLQAQSPYSASKIGADKITESFYNSYDLPVTTLRPFNTYGPRQSGRAIIPTLISQALVGNEIHVGNLSPKRDFTFVSDTVDGFIKAAESETALGKVMNLGTGEEISITELVEKIEKILNKKLKIIVDKSRVRPNKSEVERLISNNKLAKDLIGWQPIVDLETGLQITIKWIEENIALFKVGEYEI